MISFDDCPDIRLAEEKDIPGLMDLMRLACDEIGRYPFDDEKVFNMILRYYEKRGAIIAVIGEVGAPIAYVLLVMDEIWYSYNNWQLLELSLFVHPDHRKSTYAKQLMKFSKQSSEALKIDLSIGVYTNNRTQAKIKLYQRQFTQIGAFFLYKPQESNV
jgi:GNAT superfamily N-acetyltransferase